jgi:KipI family sensor histidine kinase inhibitor
MRVLPLNESSFLVELADLAQSQTLFASLQADPLPGMTDLVPAARTLMIAYNPAVTSASLLAGAVVARDLQAPPSPSDVIIEVPVVYNGEDLPEVAALTGLSVREIIARHLASDYRVAFCGFAPGFGYLTGGDPALYVPRRKTPRTHIPAGSVGLAGEFSGVYPQASPGGWQIIGTTPLKMWDLTRSPPALFQPGHKVRFLECTTAKPRIFTTPPVNQLATTGASASTTFSVLSAPLPALFQDLGRFGQTRQGVSASGALDRGAFKTANRVVGNAQTIPCLELTGGGFSFRANGQAVIGFAGAPCSITIRTAASQRISPAFLSPIALEPGDEVTLGPPMRGVCSYLAVRGGFLVEPVLGSAATDTLAHIGPAPVQAGGTLTVQPTPYLAPVSLHEVPVFDYPKAGETVMLDLQFGPRSDWFTQEALAAFTSTAWLVTPHSNRVGLRLDGEAVLTRCRTEELPSEATITGAVEVPANGKPLLFLADHPLTGGYPVIGAVAAHHLDLAGQIPVGAKILFRPIAPFAEIIPERPNPEAAL